LLPEELVRIVFMGSTEFGVPALEALKNKGHDVAGIVSTPASPKGRGLALHDSPLVSYAKKSGYAPILTPQSLAAMSFADELRNLAADVFVVAAFRILPKAVFTIPRLGTYNIHASLLPRYRGPAPVQRAIAAGDRETGVTIFRIDAGVDTGAIVCARKTGIGPEETAPQLSERLSRLGADALVEALELVASGSSVFATQDGTLACGAPKLTKAEGRINWNRPAMEIFNMIRAFKPFPGAQTFLDDLRITVEWGVVAGERDAAAEAPGTVVAAPKDGFDVQCASGRIRVLLVRPEGKKTMTARDFANGRGIVVGTRFA
jgi:methionyl-tRNA formyltransferase